MTTTSKPVPNAEMIQHASWCQEQPGEAAPRVESFLAERTETWAAPRRDRG